MALDDYNRKRNFEQTPEPVGEIAAGQGPLRFVVQMHEASRLHYDFRIEAGGVFLSWAVPKGPSLNVQDQRLAVFVEDHPIAYGSFEGIIPKGNYGAGTVMLWDSGTYVERGSTARDDSEKAVLKGLRDGHITMVLEGQKLKGEFALVRLKDADEKSWLLVKKRDEYSGYADITRENLSVKTGRSIREIAAEAPEKGQVWLPARGAAGVGKKAAPPAAGVAPQEKVQPTPEKFPRRMKPMLPTSRDEVFEQEGWVFELDRDGYHALAELENGVVRLFSKALLPFNQKFPTVARALAGDAKIAAILDGEIVEEGDGHVFWVRDLLHLNGLNLRHLPLMERKNLLERLSIFNETIRYCAHEGQSAGLIETAAQDGLHGVLARDAYAEYKSGTTGKWLRVPVKASREQGPSLTHLEKIYWPQEKFTKGDVVEYYRKIAPVLLPHLLGRPESLHRHPDGIEAPGFFQKDLVGHRPRWVQTERIFSESVARSIDYLVCQNEATLLYMANLGCIELNPWLSRVGTLDKPDFVLIDLDPDKTRETSYDEVVSVAQELHRILDAIGAFHLCKTSGATGLHFYIPVQARYSYEEARGFALAVCQVLHKKLPDQTSLDRTPAKRRGKIYLDCFQNAQGQTVAAPYSLRPRPGAPVSTPLLWRELVPGLRPEHFNLKTLPERVERVGELWRPILEQSVDLSACLAKLSSDF